MAAFSLWQLLNLRQPLAGEDPSDPAQQQQSSGQAIGQSLNDLWNRAEDDGLDHRVRRSGSLDGAFLAQQMPSYSGDFSNYCDTPLMNLLAGGFSPTGPADTQPDAQLWTQQPRNPNFQTVQWQVRAAQVAEEAAKKYGPLIGGAIAHWWNSHRKPPSSKSPPPAMPDSSNSSSDQPPSIIDDNAAADTRTTVPAPSAIPASPSAGRTIGDFSVGSESPFEDSDFLPRFDAATPDDEINFSGDYSRGRHNPFVNFQIDSLRKAGCIVEPNMRLGSLDDPRIAIADWMHQCYGRDLPTVGEGKTGRGRKFTTNQNVVYPAVQAGRGYSPSPRIASFGLTPWSQLPPLQVMRSWSPWHGAPVQDDYPFGGAP